MEKVSFKNVQQVWNILLKSQLSRFVRMHEVLLHMCLVLRALLILNFTNASRYKSRNYRKSRKSWKISLSAKKQLRHGWLRSQVVTMGYIFFASGALRTLRVGVVLRNSTRSVTIYNFHKRHC